MVNLKIFCLYCSAKHGKAYDFIDSEYKAQTLQHWWYWCVTSFGFKEFLNVFDEIILQRFLQDIQIKHGFLIMQVLQRLHQLRWIDRLAKQSSEYEK